MALVLPPDAPELNSAETVWEYLRSNWLSHKVWDTTTPSRCLLRRMERVDTGARAPELDHKPLLGNSVHRIAPVVSSVP